MPAINQPRIAPATEPYQRPMIRNMAIRSRPLPIDLARIRNTIEIAIRDRHLEPSQVYINVMNEDLGNIINYSRSNLEKYRRFATAKEHQIFYQIEFAIHQQNPTETSENRIAEQFDITQREARRAKRTFNFFRHWPKAINQLGNLKLNDWDKITNTQLENLLDEMLIRHGADETEYLLDFEEEPQTVPEITLLTQEDPEIDAWVEAYLNLEALT